MKKQLLYAFVALFLVFLAAFAPFSHAERKLPAASPALMSAQTARDFQAAGEAVAAAEGAFAQALSGGMKEVAAQQKMAEQMEAVQQPETLVPLFMRNWKAFAKSASQSSSLAKTGALSALQTGISGTVLESGEPPLFETNVVAF